jgi:hypothetical protein
MGVNRTSFAWKDTYPCLKEVKSPATGVNLIPLGKRRIRTNNLTGTDLAKHIPYQITQALHSATLAIPEATAARLLELGLLASHTSVPRTLRPVGKPKRRNQRGKQASSPATGVNLVPLGKHRGWGSTINGIGF